MTKPDGTDLTFDDVHDIVNTVRDLIDKFIKMIAQLVNGAKGGFKEWVAEYDYSYTE